MRENPTSPWQGVGSAPAHDLGAIAAPATPSPGVAGVDAPQPGIPAPEAADRLPIVPQYAMARLWWLGTHGGAGESTLANLVEYTAAAGHAWPVPADPRIAVQNHVMLVARTSYSGLRSAQRAAMQWAAQTLPASIYLEGLVLIADAPGKLPKDLRDLATVISGGVRQTWMLPWSEDWRRGNLSPRTAPRELHRLFNDLQIPLTFKEQS